MGIDFRQMIEMQKIMMDQISIYMSALGLELTLDRIDIEPKDCPDKCVDMIWRFKCKEKEICDKLKEKIVEAFGGEGGS
mgnify:CR=1 FL=1